MGKIKIIRDGGDGGFWGRLGERDRMKQVKGLDGVVRGYFRELYRTSREGLRLLDVVVLLLGASETSYFVVLH